MTSAEWMSLVLVISFIGAALIASTAILVTACMLSSTISQAKEANAGNLC